MTEQGHPIHDGDRERAAAALQRACGEGRLSLEEFGDRVGAAWAADDSAQLAEATRGLPGVPDRVAPTAYVGQRDQSANLSLLGSYVRKGRFVMPRRLQVVALVGATDIDLRGALIADPVVEIVAYSLLGSVRVTVPEGIEVELDGLSLLGSREMRLTPVPRVPGTPLVRVTAYSALGSVTVRSKR